MISHIHLGVTNFEAALAFYDAVLGELGWVRRFCEPERPWAGWQVPGQARPLWLIGRPWDGAAARVGNGTMHALLAPDRPTVDRVHALALRLGARCEGPPGLRPHYHAHYWGAYFRDPEGHKLCVVCHEPVPGVATG